MLKNSFFKKIVLVATVVLLCSCDKDYNAVGSDLIGDNNFDFETYNSDLVAYNRKITPVQSNNLATNALGIYDDPAFGTKTANFVTQVNLGAYAPTIGESPEIESVILTIPYFSTATQNNSDGTTIYKLDSISGSPEGKLKLSIYESDYYLRNLDPSSDFQNQQLYYTDQNSTVDGLKKGNPLNNSDDKKENDAFFFDKSQIVITTVDPETKKETKTYDKPQMKLHLDNDFFKDKILKANASNLASANAFTNYFRGLYFKVEKSGSSPSNLAMLNFAEGKITIIYKAKTAITTDEETETEEKTIVLNLTGNTISLQEESGSTPNYVAATSTNTTTSDPKLYLRGGQGSMAVIELFDKTDLLGYDANGTLTGPNGVSDELDDLRQRYKKNQLLINEANLIFYIDTDQMKDSFEPNQIYVYDLTNNQAIVDASNPSLFDGMLAKNSSTKRGVSYKIRVTNHIRALIRTTTATNVKLGLVVGDGNASLGFSKLKTPIEIKADEFITEVPKGNVMSPRGTIIYGSSASTEDPTKKLKLQIYYTKPN